MALFHTEVVHISFQRLLRVFGARGADAQSASSPVLPVEVESEKTSWFPFAASRARYNQVYDEGLSALQFAQTQLLNERRLQQAYGSDLQFVDEDDLSAYLVTPIINGYAATRIIAVNFHGFLLDSMVQ